MDSAVVPINVAGNTLDVWRNEYFGSTDLNDPSKEATVWGDKADPEKDGRDNLLEFALGRNPNEREASQIGLAASVVDIGSNKYLALTFNRRKNETLLQYVPEVSSDKQTWTSGSSFVRQIATSNLDAAFEVATFQDLTSLAPGSPRFIRLRIIKN